MIIAGGKVRQIRRVHPAHTFPPLTPLGVVNNAEDKPVITQ